MTCSKPGWARYSDRAIHRFPSSRREPGPIKFVKRGQRRPVDSIQGVPAFAGMTNGGITSLATLAASYILAQGLVCSGIDGGLLVVLEHLLPDAVRLDGRRFAPTLDPCIVI